MTSTTTSTYNGGAYRQPVQSTDNKLNEFGSLLINQVPAVFAQYQVAAVQSKVVSDKTPIFSDLAGTDADGNPLPVLIIYPFSGQIKSAGQTLTTSYVFVALLIEPTQHQTIWRASIDTGTWRIGPRYHSGGTASG